MWPATEQHEGSAMTGSGEAVPPEDLGCGHGAPSRSRLADLGDWATGRLTVCGAFACSCGATGWICHSGVRLGPKGPLVVDRIESVSAGFVLRSPDSLRCEACGQAIRA
jgi:hypothetical protein